MLSGVFLATFNKNVGLLMPHHNRDLQKKKSEIKLRQRKIFFKWVLRPLVDFEQSINIGKVRNGFF